MTETRSFIERDETNIIKGIAIIFMFIHHFFTIPYYLIDSVAEIYRNNNFSFFYSSFRLCVPIFAFLTGFFYHFANKKVLRYSIKKATDLWITYFVVFICFVITEFFLGVYDFSLPRFLLRCLPLQGEL